MGATAALVIDYFGTAGAAAGAAELGTAAAIGEGAIATGVIGGGAGAAIGTDLGLLGATAATGAAAATGGSLLGTIGTQAAGALAGSVASSLLAPSPTKAPSVTPPVGMPDPLAQEQARKQSMIEQMARRGRASTILTDNAGSGGKLGG